jgi:RNA polymerase sigma-70 factor, ECF subfamily
MNNSELMFQNIHDNFRSRVLRYLVGLVGEHDAEDLTQEVFIKIDRGLKSFRGESQLST